MQKYDAAEYIDVLVTLELAVRFAELYGEKTNRTLRQSWNAIRGRVANTFNRNIFDGITRQQLPIGALRMVRRQLDEAVS